jgi:fructan beta-fructosidase
MHIKRNSLGQSLVEYALLIVLIALIVILVLSLLGVNLTDVYCYISEKLGTQPAVCTGSLFSDDFNNLSNWEIISGKWEIKNGKLCTSGSGQIFKPLKGASDYVINLNGAKLDKGNGYGVFFRADNFKKVNGYTFQYDPGLSGMVFREWYHGNEFSPSAYYKPGAYDYYSSPHDIQIVVKGNTYTTFVDGKQVVQTTDSTYTEGGIGLRSWDSSVVCFDSITVNALP